MQHTLLFSDLNLNIQTILSALGYKTVMPEPIIRDMIEALINQSASHCEPSYSFKIYDGTIEGDHLFIDSVRFDIGTIIAHALKGAEYFAFFIATAGRRFQQWSERFDKPDDLVSHFIIDSIGSEITEKAADIMQQAVKQQGLEINLSITNRFSPGYCGWNVNEQNRLFSLLKEDNCQVNLLDSGLMYPIKSVSGIIGLGTNVKRRKYSCDYCNYKDCFRRKEKL